MKSICFISGSSPKFLGGVSLYQRNLIKYSKENNLKLNFTWIYSGNENRKYVFEGIECIEIKSSKYPILKEFSFSKKVKKIILKENFDIINTHANWGYCLSHYKKKEGKKIIHTYHGATYPYMKIQFAKLGNLKYLFYPLLPFFYLMEKPPMKKADKIICVSEKVKKGLEKLYWKRDNVLVLRTGVDTKAFKKLSKNSSRKILGLKKDCVYGLYSGRGGYWNKGLDRVISLGVELHKQNNDFKLLILGADKNKCKKFLNFPFVKYIGLVKRKELPKYYSSADFFFSFSRYEGGAPNLALSEAISSKCLVLCSFDSQPEILKDKEDCLILKNYGRKEAIAILDQLKNKEEIKKMINNAKKKILELSLDKWGKKYFDIFEQ